MRTAKPFQPWKKNISNGLFAILILVILWLAYSYLNIKYEKLIFAGVPVFAYALWQFKRASARSFGQRLERKSIKKLASVISSENIRANLFFPGHGDIDCVLKINNRIFNVEIKAYQEINRINLAHIKQTLAASVYLNSKPVIWLPNFKETHFSKRYGVLICACDAQRLVRNLT